MDSSTITAESGRECMIAPNIQTPFPIQRLPEDILGEVFIMGSRDCDLPTFVWHISHVCRAWRTLALSISELWCRIRIASSSRFLTDELKTLLDRSRSRLLDISLNEKLNWDIHKEASLSTEVEQQFATTFSKLLLPHIGRWRTLELCPESSSSTHTILSMLSGEATNLVDLYLGNYYAEDDRFPHIFPPSFRAPRLRVLTIFDYPVQWNGNPLGSVTSVEHLHLHLRNSFDYLPIANLVPLIVSQSKLELLRLDGIGHGYVLEDSGPPQRLPSLIGAIFQNTPDKIIECFFMAFEAPELDHMIFGALTRYPPFGPSILGRLPDHFPKLCHFRILNECLVSDCVTLLKAPCITELVLHISKEEDGLTDDIFVRMQKPDSPGDLWLCPRLKTLQVHGVAENTTFLLRRMVEARLKASLESLSESPCAIDGLCVAGISVPESDRMWFLNNVRDFTYFSSTAAAGNFKLSDSEIDIVFGR